MFDPRHGYPTVVPYVRYGDPAAAIIWLSTVLRARELLRMPLPDGRIGHAELAIGRHVISVGLARGGAFPASPPVDRDAVRSMTLVFVDDVDAAVERAVAGGGRLVGQAVDQPWGLRQAVVTDPEGHVWELSTHQRDVAPEEWGAQTADQN